MKFKCCNQILSGLLLNHDGVKYCTEIWQGPEYIYFNEENAIQKNEERRKQIIKEMQSNIFPHNCINCPNLIEKDWDLKNKEIYKLTIYNWNHCNSSCIYCAASSTFSPVPKKSDFYDVLPIIEELIKTNKITENTFCAIQGGEPTMLEEFPAIIKKLLEVNCKIEVLSNGIVYDKSITDVINAEKDNAFCISLDCGSKQMFKKLKGVDKYLEVTQNIKKYISETGDNSLKMRIKYIVLPNINDTKKEIDKFFKFCKSAKVISLACTVNYSSNHFQNVKEKYKYSTLLGYEYFLKKAKAENFNFIPETWVEELIKKEQIESKRFSLLEKLKAIFYFYFTDK